MIAANAYYKDEALRLAIKCMTRLIARAKIIEQPFYGSLKSRGDTITIRRPVRFEATFNERQAL